MLYKVYKLVQTQISPEAGEPGIMGNPTQAFPFMLRPIDFQDVQGSYFKDPSAAVEKMLNHHDKLEGSEYVILPTIYIPYK